LKAEADLGEQRKDVVNALHASAHTESWTECRSPLHSAFHERTENASITIIPKVLAKIPVLIFAGDQDLICNYVGLEAMIKEMTWNGATGLGVFFGIYGVLLIFDEF
jgi:carboxypeptidase D